MQHKAFSVLEFSKTSSVIMVQQVEGTYNIYNYSEWNLRAYLIVCNLFCNCNTFSLLDIIIWNRVILFETRCIILVYLTWAVSVSVL